MITFVHLSDIHFIDRDLGSQFDLDQQIRRALLEDLELKPADGVDYDGILITGDIAFSGKQEEYRNAQAWLNSVFERTGAAAANTYMVPGNHDVDRSFVEPDLPLWAAHVQLREANNPTVWHDHVYKQLVRDPQRSLMAPLGGYNSFAQGYGCFTGMVKASTEGEPDKPQLAWQRTFEKPLDANGRSVRLHGLNSALISDEADAPAKLLVSQFQTSHFEHTPGVVDVVLCHHPPEWLMDKAALRDALRTFAPVSLFGHEHSTRVVADNKQVQLFAGAVQPSRRDPGDWLPTYHVLQLSVVANGNQSDLLVRIHTREFDKQNFKFRPRPTEEGLSVEEHRLKLPPWPPAPTTTTILVEAGAPTALSSVPVNAPPPVEPTMPTRTETAQRELLVHFFRLNTPDRYAAASEARLLRDGDDSLHPQAMWAEVFRRASKEEHGLADFWAAVAARTPSLKNAENPFTS
ncbi:MAG TPA: metallophosphoesterase [Bryobacteraceae bacterium]|jgi:3',5'-cyclic AMP phosphodiesterase CpdA